MRPIKLLYRQRSPALEEMLGQLDAHFGAGTVVRCEGSISHVEKVDILIVLLAKPGNHNSAGFPLDETEAIVSCGVAEALTTGATLIPVLLDGAVMPDRKRLPESIRRLAFHHAIQVRTGEEMPRDVGRLVRDLEVQSRRAVGLVYPWDYWLMPVGICAALFGLFALFFWQLELTIWTYNYEKQEDLQNTRRMLGVPGLLAMGGGMFLVTSAICWRRYRFDVGQRAAYYRSGTGSLPAERDYLAVGCFVLGAAALGWGWWSAPIAVTLGVLALARLRTSKQTQTTPRAIWFGIACGVVGSGWMIYQQQSWSHFQSSLAAYEAGRASLEAEKTEDAEREFQRAIASHSWYGQPHYRLGVLYDQTKKTDLALASLEEAFRHYPTTPRGFWDPFRDSVQEAYEYRAALHQRLGDEELAEQDRQLADKVDRSSNFFSGMLRYWEWWEESEPLTIEFGDSPPPPPPYESSP